MTLNKVLNEMKLLKVKYGTDDKQVLKNLGGIINFVNSSLNNYIKTSFDKSIGDWKEIEDSLYENWKYENEYPKFIIYSSGGKRSGLDENPGYAVDFKNIKDDNMEHEQFINNHCWKKEKTAKYKSFSDLKANLKKDLPEIANGRIEDFEDDIYNFLEDKFVDANSHLVNKVADFKKEQEDFNSEEFGVKIIPTEDKEHEVIITVDNKEYKLGNLEDEGFGDKLETLRKKLFGPTAVDYKPWRYYHYTNKYSSSSQEEKNNEKEEAEIK